MNIRQKSHFSIVSLVIILLASVPAAIIVVSFGREMVMSGNTRPAQITVTGLRWQRFQEVEKYMTFHENTSADAVPSEAYNVNRYTVTNDDSTDERAAYDINRWSVDRTLTASGTLDQARLWPALDFTPDKGSKLARSVLASNPNPSLSSSRCPMAGFSPSTRPAIKPGSVSRWARRSPLLSTCTASRVGAASSSSRESEGSR